MVQIQGTSKLLTCQIDKNNIADSIEYWIMNVKFFFLSSSFLSLRVWDSKLTNPKLGDQPQLWPASLPVSNWSILVDIFSKTAAPIYIYIYIQIDR